MSEYFKEGDTCATTNNSKSAMDDPETHSLRYNSML